MVRQETGFVPANFPGTNPVKSLGQSQGRREAQKVYVIKIMCLFRSLNGGPVRNAPMGVDPVEKRMDVIPAQDWAVCAKACPQYC